MKLSDYFDRAGTRKIVINSDIDGFLSGMILHKYYECEIVGFSNSKESIWVTPDIASFPDAEALRTPIYIDIFVNDRYVYSVDQHIIAFDGDHIDALLEWGTKLNPNINMSRRSFLSGPGKNEDYYHKYPFGTVHYLIALMKEDGIDVEINDLDTHFSIKGADAKTYDVTPGQVVLRADDALYSSLGRYRENAVEWWNTLSKSGSQTIGRLKKYLESCDKKCNEQYKRNIGQFFVKGLKCDGIDGAFDSITDHNGALQNRIAEYNSAINRIIGIEMSLPNNLVEYQGVSYKRPFTAANISRALTYAFVTGPSKSDICFSFTTRMKKNE